MFCEIAHLLLHAIWLRLLPQGNHRHFYESSLVDWLSFNLSHCNVVVTEIPWDIIFGISCWYLWKWRNSFIFEEKLVTIEGRINTILSFASTINTSCGIIRDGFEMQLVGFGLNSNKMVFPQGFG